jgi:hypothetical protein
MQSLKDWLEVAAYVVAILAAGGSWWQYRRNSARERTRWLFELYQRFYGSPGLQDMFSRIDWAETSFIEQEKPKLLQKLDEYLNFFEFVAILHKRKELKKDEIVDMFDYPLRKIAQDQPIIKYLRRNGYEQLDALLKDLRYAL